MTDEMKLRKRAILASAVKVMGSVAYFDKHSV